jgi:hypothetical protein
LEHRALARIVIPLFGTSRFSVIKPPLSYFAKEISDFLKKNAWYVCCCSEEEKCPGGRCVYPLSEKVVIPCKPKHCLKSGDAIMFFDYDNDEDRFYVIDEEDLENWEGGPVGIVFRPTIQAPKILVDSLKTA